MTPQEYTERLTVLECDYAAKLAAHFERIATAIHPLPVSEGYVRRYIAEGSITIAHGERVEALEREFYAPLLAELAEDESCAS